VALERWLGTVGGEQRGRGVGMGAKARRPGLQGRLGSEHWAAGAGGGLATSWWRSRRCFGKIVSFALRWQGPGLWSLSWAPAKGSGVFSFVRPFSSFTAFALPSSFATLAAFLSSPHSRFPFVVSL